MINSKLFTLLFVILFLGIQAQEEEFTFKSIDDGKERKNIIVSVSLLSSLDINTPSLQIGLDLKISEIVGIHQEFGYINNWINPIYAFIDQESSQNFKLKNGVKYIFEPRFYPFNKEKKISKSVFFAPSFDFRYVNILRNGWVGRYNFSYTQFMDFNVNKLAFGGMAKFGFTTRPEKKTPLDIVFGLGVRYSVKSNTLPEDAELANNGGNFFNVPPIEGPQWHPAVYYGMLLHLPMKKKK